MVEPAAGVEAQRKNDTARCPVGEHADPYGDRSEAPYAAQVNAKAYTAQPHGAAGDDHGEPDIACGAHSVSRDERQYPRNRLYDRDKQHHLHAELCALRFHSAEHRNRLGQSEYEQAAADDDKLGDPGELLDIVDRLVLASRTETLSDNGHKTDADSHGSDTV